MKRKDLILILILLAFAAAVLLFGIRSRGSFQAKPSSVPESASVADPDVEPENDNTPPSEEASSFSQNILDAAAAYFEANPAESYLLVRTETSAMPLIPLTEEHSFSVTQQDGSENVIHVGLNSFYMESSNCDNQNCVNEGVVTLDNMNERILFNMILCLPHQLSLEMLTPDQAEDVLCEMLAYQEAQRAAMQEYQTAEDEKGN